MNFTTDREGQSPQLLRLIEQVERRQLHRGSGFDDPRAWLVHWLGTPDADLNGRKPISFIEEADWDLILVGLLIRKRTRQAWHDTAASHGHVSAQPDCVPDCASEAFQ
jgi:hypothetical protein